MTTPTQINVYFDYVCPFCLLAEDAINTVAAEHGIRVDWRPFELRPAPAPTLRPEDDYLPQIWRSAVYPMAARLGIEISLPSVSPQPYSHTAFEGYQHARSHSRGTAYNERVLRAFFQQDRDIGRLDVLADIAAGVGLDADEFTTALAERRYAEAHRAELAEAYAAGVRMVPTVDVGSYRLEGVPSPQQLRAALSFIPTSGQPIP
jgi:predicted DsbA family dithiol-disulfide isomerase